MAVYPPFIQQFIADFQQKRWAAQPFERALEIVTLHPEQLVPFINALVTELPEGGTFLDVLFSFLPLHDFSEIVQHALRRYEENKQHENERNEAAASVIAYSTLQCLPTVHPHLPTIFESGVNEDTYYSEWPWREAGAEALTFLQAVLADTQRGDEERVRAWLALLETRHPVLMDFAHRNVERVPLTLDPTLYYMEVGYELQQEHLVAIYPQKCYHLRFAPDYFDNASRPAWMRTTFHPTWNLADPASGPHLFGGSLAETVPAGCPSCGRRLHHMITLDPVPGDLGITGFESLTLATCLSCLGWEPEKLFYHHDASGQPQAIGLTGELKTPDFPASPFRPTEVRLVETPARWRWQSWGASNGRENLHRVGGFPCWIQGAEHPACPVCEGTMHFLMQMDSDLPTTDGREWLWGSGGMGYVFWCDGCNISNVSWQCT